MNPREPTAREKITARELLHPESRALEMYQYLSGSPKVQSYLRTANRMAVSRLGYTDHGPVHAEVATWNSLKVFDILEETFQPNVVAEEIGNDLIKKKLLNDDGTMLTGTIILINGHDIYHMDKLDTAVKKNDVVSLFPPVAGG